MWALSLFSNMFKNKLKWFLQLSACAAPGGGRSQPSVSETWIRLLVPRLV